MPPIFSLFQVSKKTLPSDARRCGAPTKATLFQIAARKVLFTKTRRTAPTVPCSLKGGLSSLLLFSQTLLKAILLNCDLFHVLKGVIALFTGSYLYDILNIVYEYLSVADVTGIKHLFSCFYNASYRHLADYDINLYLRQQACLVFRSRVRVKQSYR